MNFIIQIILLSALSLNAQAKVVKDVHNNSVNVPDRVERVFGSSPPMNYLIYAIDPNKMIGLNFKAKNPNNFATEEFLDEKFLSLPILGSFHGGGKNINLEVLMSKKPDLILLWDDDMLVATVQKEISKTKVPTISTPFRKIEDIPESIRFVADAMDEHERGIKLSQYAQNTIDNVKESLKEVKPVRYYYAEGIDGLSTECDRSFHVEALNFAGGVNVHKCQQSGILGLEKINFETLLKYDPDVIIVQGSYTYNEIMFDEMWKHLKAVKNNRVFLVPNTPFNWIDRPPSFMRILGIQWLSHIFHPKKYKIDLDKEIKEFYELFLNTKVSNKQIKKILGENR